MNQWVNTCLYASIAITITIALNKIKQMMKWSKWNSKSNNDNVLNQTKETK